jgi:SAM-dependent methyltransferase
VFSLATRTQQRWQRRRSGPAGQVEVFSQREIVGWVRVAATAAPTRITLHVDELEVAGTWAADVIHAGPAERRGFRLALHDVWQYCRAGTRLSVRADGEPLHIAGAGLARIVAQDGRRTVAQLEARLAAGHVFGQFGRLQLSKTRDVVWQRAVLEIYARINAVLRDEFGYPAFLCYGTLLGAVRENGFIGHDLDFDAAYVSRHRDGAAAARELRDIALRLVDAGLDVTCKRTALHIYDDTLRGARVDLFHLYFDRDGRLAFPFGIAGESVITEDAWDGVREIEFAGGRGHVPANAAELVEHIYGPNWRVPKPGFHWDRDRTTRAPRESIMPVDFGVEVYWENFYARRSLAGPSPFALELTARPDLPQTVLDLGCGDGRDAVHFARAGRRVIGVDRSPRGLATARARAAAANVPAVFYRRDFRTGDALIGLDLPPSPVLFYARFLLHAVGEATEDQVLTGIAARARPGDELALEVRIGPGSWTYGRHYRRLVEPAALQSRLERDGWTIVDSRSGPGLAPHAGEDPQVLRVLARKR